MSKMRNNQGVVLLMTILILSGVLVVTLAAADLVMAGLKMNRLTGYSNLAFFASEAGMERAMWEARRNNYSLPEQSQEGVFENANIGNNSSYFVNYSSSTPYVTFQSICSYRGVKRSVEGAYLLGELPSCKPDCIGKNCGDDGCGGSCGSCAANEVCNLGICEAGEPASPSNLALSHTANNESFTVSWTAGSGNGGIGGCKMQFYTGSTWADISSAADVNCDTDLSEGAFTLNADGWKAHWNGTEVRLVRKSDLTAVGTFPQTLSCTTLSGSATPTPSIDEDCNGYWDNTTLVNCQPVCESWGCWFRYESWSIYPTCSGTSYGVHDICLYCELPLGCNGVGQNYYIGPGDACCVNYTQDCDTLYN